MDTYTQERIALLHPSVRDEMTQIITVCDKVLSGRAKVRITQSLRTFKEQDALYALGRKKKGTIVTQAKGGQSIHNYGFAVDICLVINQKEISWDTIKDWDNDQVSDWYECVKIFAQYGWEWGGNWKNFKDLPHFDKKGYNNWKQLKQLHFAPNGYVII